MSQNRQVGNSSATESKKKKTQTALKGVRENATNKKTAVENHTQRGKTRETKIARKKRIYVP